MSLATQFAPSVPVPARTRLPLAPHAPLSPPCDAAAVRVLRAPSSPELAAPVRLTRRGVLVLALGVCVLGAALVWLAGVAAPAEPPAPGAPGPPAHLPATITVQSGDTLWSIASRVAPRRDPRAEVATLQRVNHLGGADLAVGQVLRLGAAP